MNGYRRGTVLGLTVAETFILLTFLLLIALLGLIQPDEPPREPETPSSPKVWVRPEEITTLMNEATKAQIAQEKAERDRDAAERARDKAREEARKAHAAQERAQRDRAAAESDRNRAQERAEKALEAEKKAEQSRAATERERDQAQRNLALLRRKGENPPCWYQVVSAGEGKTREKPYYVLNVAIFENSIAMDRRTAPPGGAFDDGGELYADEWKRLRIEELPYGRRLNDKEFIEAISPLVARGRNRQVRTYECVFSVMVWDKTPDHAKKRWKDAHDRIIESSFSAYTVQDLKWKGVE